MADYQFVSMRLGDNSVGAFVLQGSEDTLGHIIEEGVHKRATLTEMPLYGLDSDEAFVMDFGGAVRIIDLRGEYGGATASQAKTFVSNLEALINGQQDSTVTPSYPLEFESLMRTTNIRVKVADVNYTVVAGEVYIVRYSLKLIESAQNV